MVSKETWGSDYLVVWAMATTTDGFKEDKLSVASQQSMGVQFLRQAVDASMQLHSYRYSYTEEYFCRQYPQLATIKHWLHALLESRRGGGGDRVGDGDLEAGQEDTASAGDSDAAGWTDGRTGEEEDVWGGRPPTRPGERLVG